MKKFVRYAIFSIAALALAGCKTTEEPSKLGEKFSKHSVRLGVANVGQGNSWNGNQMDGFGGYVESDEPDTPNWMRQQKEMTGNKPSIQASGLALQNHVHVQKRPLSRIASIRKMARRLAPAGVSLASLSDMVGKRRQAKIGCLPKELRMLLNTVAWHYGKHVHIQSGYRSKHHNRRVGGARRSLHVACKAVDIKVSGVNKYRLARYLKSLPGRGGVGNYCNNSTVHIDVGPKRQWHYGCGMKSKAKRRLARYKRKRRKSYK